MIEHIRMYHLDKHAFQGYIIQTKDFKHVIMYFDVWTKKIEYPLVAERDGISVTIDEYRAYINGVPRIIYNSSTNSYLTSYTDLTFTKLKSALKTLDGFILNPNQTKLSAIKFGFSIPVNTIGADIVKLNILMFKFHYYNHNKQKNKRQVLKEFDFTDFKIGVYADRVNTYNEKVLKIVLHLKKSVEFKKLGIYDINDLLQKKKLEALFDILMKRFNELIIVDNFEIFEGKDYHQLKDFLDYRYWENIANNKSRQTLSRNRKQFKKLIAKYGLDSQRLHLRNELKKAFTHFISN